VATEDPGENFKHVRRLSAVILIQGIISHIAQEQKQKNHERAAGNFFLQGARLSPEIYISEFTAVRPSSQLLSPLRAQIRGRYSL
jgi:hypothetical protein